MTPEEEERWIDRILDDHEFADAVLDGEAPRDEAPDWYPQLTEVLAAARAEADEHEPAALTEKQSAEGRWRRLLRRLGLKVVIGGAALGLGASAAAAAISDGAVLSMPAPFDSGDDGTDNDVVDDDREAEPAADEDAPPGPPSTTTPTTAPTTRPTTTPTTAPATRPTTTAPPPAADVAEPLADGVPDRYGLDPGQQADDSAKDCAGPGKPEAGDGRADEVRADPDSAAQPSSVEKCEPAGHRFRARRAV
jgi:cell division septation protein DedD